MNDSYFLSLLKFDIDETTIYNTYPTYECNNNIRF